MKYYKLRSLLFEADDAPAQDTTKEDQQETGSPSLSGDTEMIPTPWDYASSSAIPPMEMTDFDLGDGDAAKDEQKPLDWDVQADEAPAQDAGAEDKPADDAAGQDDSLASFVKDFSKEEGEGEGEAKGDDVDPDRDFKPDTDEDAEEDGLEGEDDQPEKKEVKEGDAVELAVKTKMDSLGKEALESFKAILSDEEKMRLLYAKIERVGMENMMRSYIKDIFVKQLKTEKDKMFVMINLDNFAKLVVQLVLGELL